MRPLFDAFAISLCMPVMLFAQQTAQNSEAQSQERDRGRRIVGQYEITSGAKDGVEIPKERLNNTVAITRDTIAVVDRDKKELYSASYKLTRSGTERGLWNIDMESKVPQAGSKAVGLLKRNGEELWLIYAIDGKRPENFEKTTKGQHLFKMKRKADAAVGGEAAKGE